MKNLLASIIGIAIITSMPVHSAVLEAGETGFVIEIVTDVTQPVDASYQQFLRVNEWWDGEHSYFGDAENFSLDPRVGGCFCEIDGQRQVEHMRVSFVDPNIEIRLLGGLGPLQMMGMHGAMSWRFAQNGQGGTTITQRYVVSGYHKAGMASLALAVDQVQTGQQLRLTARLNEN